MKQITIVTEDKMGFLAEVSYLLGKAKVNIESLQVEVCGKKAMLNLVVKDEKKASAILKSNGFEVLESELLIVHLKDEPTNMFEMTEILRKANVSVLNTYTVARDKGICVVALRVDHLTKAKRLLAPYMKPSIEL